MLSRIPRSSSGLWRLVRLPASRLVITRGLQTPSSPQKDQKPPLSPDVQSPNADRNEANPGEPPSQPKMSDQEISSVLSNIDPSENPLIAPVHIPEDPKAVLRSDHPVTSLLSHSGLVVTRQIEMMNIFLGFEQANRYIIMDPQGNHVGYMAETDGGIGKSLVRNFATTHRAFTTNIFDKHGQEVLRFHRPFSAIKTRIRVYDPLEVGKYAPRNDNVKDLSTAVKDPGDEKSHVLSTLPLEAMRIIGEAHSEWAPLRRKYNLYLAHELKGIAAGAIGNVPVPDDLSAQQQNQIVKKKHVDTFAQFAYVDERWLSWDFTLKGANDQVLGSVNRQWRGFGRELFTDTGMYVLRMDSAASEDPAADRGQVANRAYSEALGGESKSGMTLDQRAVMLATAVTLDFDYFSRHSNNNDMMFMPIWLGGGAGGGAAGSEAGGAVIGGAAGRGVAGTASEIGAGEGAIAGAGSLAGYEAMQRGLGRGDDASPVSPQAEFPSADASPYDSANPQAPQDGYGGPQDSGDTWGTGDSDPWSDKGGDGDGGGDGESGGGLLSTLWDSFFGS